MFFMYVQTSDVIQAMLLQQRDGTLLLYKVYKNWTTTYVAYREGYRRENISIIIII